MPHTNGLRDLCPHPPQTHNCSHCSAPFRSLWLTPAPFHPRPLAIYQPQEKSLSLSHLALTLRFMPSNSDASAPRVVLLRVGVDSGEGGIQGPLLKEDTFEFLPIPCSPKVNV